MHEARSAPPGASAAGLTAREVSKSFALGGRELPVLRGVGPRHMTTVYARHNECRPSR